MKFQAPAKINLKLKVTGRRPNGYHALEMIMVKLAFGDEIDLEIGGSDIRVACSDPNLKVDASNLIWKAAEKVRQESGKAFGLKAFLKKQTPVAAGLGGGSSDAATTLMGLNQLLDLGWSREKLQEVGVTLGADVPFFLTEGSQEVKGIGEVLSPVSLPPLFLVLINPGFPVSTPEAFGWFDDLGRTQGSPLPVDSQLTTLLPTGTYPPLFNDLERVVIPRYPVLAEIKRLISEAGALGTLMSGSGPTVFGLFESEASRDRGYESLLKRLKYQDPQWWICKTQSKE